MGHNSNYGSYIYRYHKKHHTIHYPIQKLLDNKPYKTDYNLYIFSDGLIAYFFPILFLGYLNYKLLDYESFINLTVNFTLLPLEINFLAFLILKL